MPGFFLGVVDEAGEGRERRGRMAHQQLRHFRHDRDRHEVLLGVVGQLRIDRSVDGVIGRGEQQRVAVGRGLGSRIGGDDAAGARLVLDHERPPEVFRHARGHEAGDVIDRPTGRERQQQPDRPFGILRGAWERGRQRQAQGCSSRLHKAAKKFQRVAHALVPWAGRILAQQKYSFSAVSPKILARAASFGTHSISQSIVS